MAIKTKNVQNHSDLTMKLIIFYAVLLSSCATLSTSSGDSGGGGLPPCVVKLMPCLSFLRSPETPPTAVCCIPLKSALVDDATCLCSLFENEGLVGSLNITRQDLLDLPPRCGLESPDLNKCDHSITPNPSHLPPTPPVNEPPEGITPPPPSSSSGPGACIQQKILSVALAAFWIFTSL